MKLPPPAILVALALAACATPCPGGPAGVTQQRFACADGSRLDVTFDRASGRAFVSEDGGASLVLDVQISGVGFRYVGAGAELRSGRNSSEVLWSAPSAPARSVVETTPERQRVSCTAES